MAGVTKKEGRIPPLLPQTSSSFSLSLSPSLSLFLIAPSSALYVDGVAVPDLFVSPLGMQPSRAASNSRYPRHSFSPFFLSLSHPRLSFSFSHLLAHSRWVAGARSLSLTLIALASVEWKKSQPSPKPRLRPGHARHPPSPLRLSLPLFLLPLSPRSTHLTLSPRPFFPTWVVVVAAEHHYRLAQAVVIALRRCHHPFPSSPLLLSLHALPHSPAARPPSCPCPSLVPLPGTRPSGKGLQPSPNDGHTAALHRPFVIIIIIFSFLLSRYPPISLSLSLSLSLSPSPCHFTTLYTPTFLYSWKDFFFLRMKNHGDNVREKKKNHSPSKNPSHC